MSTTVIMEVTLEIDYHLLQLNTAAPSYAAEEGNVKKWPFPWLGDSGSNGMRVN